MKVNPQKEDEPESEYLHELKFEDRARYRVRAIGAGAFAALFGFSTLYILWRILNAHTGDPTTLWLFWTSVFALVTACLCWPAARAWKSASRGDFFH